MTWTAFSRATVTVVRGKAVCGVVLSPSRHVVRGRLWLETQYPSRRRNMTVKRTPQSSVTTNRSCPCDAKAAASLLSFTSSVGAAKENLNHHLPLRLKAYHSINQIPRSKQTRGPVAPQNDNATRTLWVLAFPTPNFTYRHFPIQPY